MEQGSAYFVAAFLDHAGSRAVNGLEHGVPLADVRAARRAYAALELGRLVGQDVAVEIGKNEYLEVGTALFVYELCGGYVDIPIVGCDFGIFLCRFPCRD